MGLTVVTLQQCIKFKLHFESHYLPQKLLLLGLEVGAGTAPSSVNARSLGRNQQWGRSRVSPWQPGKEAEILGHSLGPGDRLSCSPSAWTPSQHTYLRGHRRGRWSLTPESPRYEFQPWLCNHELRDLEKFISLNFSLFKQNGNRDKFIGFCPEGEIRSYH